MEQEPQKKTRKSRRSFASQLQIALDDAATAVEKRLEISHCKLIQARIDALAPRAQAELEEKKSRVTEHENAELATLRAARETDTARIAALEAENERLKSHVCPVDVRVVPDPAHVTRITALEKREKELQNIVAFLLKHTGNKDCVALQAVRELPRESASEICEGVGWHWLEVASFNQSYKTFAQWNDIVCRASSNGNLAKLCKAAIQLDISTKTSDPLTAAKMLTGTIRSDN
jgi:hypothetical protein